MGAMEQFKDGVGHVLHSLEGGWHELSSCAHKALTHFRPGSDDAADAETVRDRSRWGLLAADVLDSDARIVVRLEVPGMDVGDLDIEAHGRHLSVRGEKRTERTDTRGGYHVRECAYGRFRRDIPLPADVSDEGASARYKRGVLEVTLPTKAAASRRRIAVRNAS